MPPDAPCPSTSRRRRVPSDGPFFIGLFVLAGIYVALILAFTGADVLYLFRYDSTTDGAAGGWRTLRTTLASPEIAGSIVLTLVTCSISAILSLFVAVPAGYLLSRVRFPGRRLADALLDIPILLPPLVVGLSLLILFNQIPLFEQTLEQWSAAAFSWLTVINPDLRPGVTFKVPAVILAQFSVAAAFAIRTMQTAFDEIHSRQEAVALTLGCNRAGAFWHVLLPQARRGILTAATLAWARALGEFGPILVFAGATRGRTEVLSTSVFLEINIGNLRGAVAVSLLMILLALALIAAVRIAGIPRDLETTGRRAGYA
ncbi:MAG TPA: ABC transporter permease [Verrucomicrobiales bacterium]|nr:ABC transporter permease [Verrucomicrobiales bacterium]